MFEVRVTSTEILGGLSAVVLSCLVYKLLRQAEYEAEASAEGGGRKAADKEEEGKKNIFVVFGV